MEKKSQANNYSQYYNGNTPQYNPGSTIDFSQISGMFSRTAETMQLVYQYDSNISQEVSYIFDFSNAGAYGVYIPALVEKVKTDELKKRLEQKGYEIGVENGTMVAYPIEKNKTNEQIENEIKQVWDQINAGKSEVIGVNINKVKSACEKNMNEIAAKAASQGGEIKNPQLMWDMLIMLELGATIVHEWEHSRGGDEGAAQSRERDFVSKSMSSVQQKYQSESGGDQMQISPTSKSTKNWYRIAQYMPQSVVAKPTGTDLDGRHGKTPPSGEGRAGWGMLNQMDQSVPIEKRLNRDNMWPLAPNIQPEHNIIEEQLRKQTFEDEKPNPKLIYEELLSKDRDNSQGYKSLEQLMEERRPSPILLPLEKTASINKISTLFGWYNNLEISDGSTIPGLGDRVMAWDDRDESFAGEEEWIKTQPRYNPEYDLKGFYYRWIEPRFKPQLWDDMSQELSNTSPAKRFASVELDPDVLQIIKILEEIKSRVLNGKIKAARLISTDDLYKLIFKVVKCEGVNVKPFRFGKTESGDDVYAVWISATSVPIETIRKAETKFQNKSAPNDLDDLVEDLLGFSNYRASVAEEIVNAVKSICQQNGEEIWAIGSYAREKAFGNDNPDVEQLNICTVSPRRNSEIGQLLAHSLGVETKVGEDMSFTYKGIIVNMSIVNRKEELVQLGYLDTPLKNQVAIDILRRDFTINMFVYNITKGTVEDPIGVAQDSVRNNVLKTYLNPYRIVKRNPMVILRALKLKMRYGLEIDKELERAMIYHSNDLFKGGCSTFDLIFGRESIKAEGSSEAESLFDDFGLWKLRQLK